MRAPCRCLGLVLVVGVLMVAALPFAVSAGTKPIVLSSGAFEVAGIYSYADFLILNNSGTTQTIRWTWYDLSSNPKLALGAGTATWTLDPGETGSGTGISGNCWCELVVETNSEAVLPSVTYWHGEASVVATPRYRIGPTDFIRLP